MDYSLFINFINDAIMHSNLKKETAYKYVDTSWAISELPREIIYGNYRLTWLVSLDRFGNKYEAKLEKSNGEMLFYQKERRSETGRTQLTKAIANIMMRFSDGTL